LPKSNRAADACNTRINNFLRFFLEILLYPQDPTLLQKKKTIWTLHISPSSQAFENLNPSEMK